MNQKNTGLAAELRQGRPFRNLEEEVVLAMLRTADRLAMPMTELLRAQGVSLSQYNVLRILRGSGQDGLPCGEICERMVRRDPDLTRLLDRLERRDLVRRARDSKDRRVVRVHISSEGVRFLEAMDQPVLTTLSETLSHMPVERMEALRVLLEEARSTGAPVPATE